MVNLYIAYTQPVNPPNSTPVLTRPQLWAGLQRKVRNAQEFVPAIISCTVLAVEDNVITREVMFADGFNNGIKKPVREVCKECAPTKVDFVQEADGSVIQNIISDGPSGHDEDLFLTYSFELLRPHVAAGSGEEVRLKAQYKKTAHMAVNSSIEAIRRMVVAGEL